MEVARRRKRIDAADRALVRLLNQRMRMSIDIGRLKQSRGLPLYDAAREREILRRARRANGGPLDRRALHRFYQWLLAESRRITSRALRTQRVTSRNHREAR
ncbi:MAG: chorismate mutase [Acidobacteria bacterium]|nr:chorismate mutase [Acidobacteriota bacterium]